MKLEEKGFLVVSLDFELLWGVFDVIDIEKNKNIFLNTIQVIPEILKIFSNSNIKCTWATVGMLFNENWDEWLQNIPENLPSYHNEKLSAYVFGQKNLNSKIEKLCFAPEVIKEISDTEGQEIGTHTYSHYYCLEPGQNNLQFENDLKKAISLAGEKRINIKSLVFPRNQFNETYIKICAKQGVINVRSNPESWYWKNSRSDSFLHKFSRSGDAYLPFGKKSYTVIHPNQKLKEVTFQKASRFLRPVDNNTILRRLKIKRIFSEMERAARKNEVYHLWWHPHNFGQNPVKSLNDLNSIISHYTKLQKKYNFTSVTMGEMGKIISTR